MDSTLYSWYSHENIFIYLYAYKGQKVHNTHINPRSCFHTLVRKYGVCVCAQREFSFIFLKLIERQTNFESTINRLLFDVTFTLITTYIDNIIHGNSY